MTYVKEQRVDGSLSLKLQLRGLKCILTGFERNYQIRILSNQINLRGTRKKMSYFLLTQYSTSKVQQVEKQNFQLNPWWVSGFTDASPKSVVVWGSNLQSLVGTGKFTKQVSNMIVLAPYQYSVVIGLLLSDGWLIFASKTNKNARLGFAQSIANGGYFWFTFWSLSHYCSSYPLVRIRSRFGKQTIGLEFFTRSMPCITELHSLFYPMV